MFVPSRLTTCSVAAFLVIIACFAQASATDVVPSREDITTGTDVATITAIDRDERTVALRYEDGREEQFVVGDDLPGFDRVGVGDRVRAGYARSLALELRAPTPEELESPLEVVTEMWADEVQEGTRSVGQVTHAVTTIEVLDRINMTATLRGPRGNYFTIDVRDAEMITQVNIGDTVLATYTEAVVLSLEKAE